ncbi:hypothetical protein AXF42_Ash002417 [Apostasia shenzhenica]|uniref:Uncharacterized protein n=1 Tax=Apostasia shenzhenica TaxID=1088818 RepID=A0A2I0ANJ9_9ASPA|nr:hypothetical protein AXF42_Ash002417 [Apostasia shenzhenica]
MEEETQELAEDLELRATLHLGVGLDLIKPFTRKEVQKKVFSFAINKTPKKDELIGNFFKGNWVIVGKEVVKIILTVFESRIITPSWEDARVTLAPKVANVDQALI